MSQDKDIQAARVAFEAVYPVPPQCIWAGNGYAATGYNAWDAQTHCHRWEGWLAARRGLASSLLEHEGTASAAVLVLCADVDELVTPATVRANEVDAEVINSGLDVVEGNLDAAADADPHGNPRMVDADLHDSLPGIGIQGCPAVLASDAAAKIARVLLGDARKVDCDIIESHIREMLAASAGDTLDAELEEAQREVESMRYQRDAWRADAKRLDKLQDESWDLRSFCIGEEDIGWRIVEFHQAAPHERVVAEVFKDDPRAAIDAATKRSGEQKA